MRANPDGHTLLLSYTSELVVVPQVNKNVKYSVEDFTPIAVTGIVPVVLIVSKKIRADNMQDLIEEIRQSPGKYTFSGGLGSPSHILGSWLNQLKQLEARHVPSRDGAQSVGDVVGGHIDMFYGGTSVVKPASNPDRSRRSRSRACARPRCRTCRPSRKRVSPISSWRAGT